MLIAIFDPINATTPGDAGGSLSPTTSSQVVTPALTQQPGADRLQGPISILFTNAGTDIVMIEMSVDPVTSPTASETTSIPILPNDKQIFKWNPRAKFAYRGITGTGSTLFWKLGYGS